MVLISIHPFALRKLFLIVVAFLGFSALCFADPVLMVRRYSARPESPKAPAQVVGQPFEALEKAALGRAPLQTQTDGSVFPVTMSAGVRTPVCVLRATVPNDGPNDEAPGLESRKI